MKYHLVIKGQTKGPFTLETVRSMLDAGAIQTSTAMAEEGNSTWRTVGDLLAVSAKGIDVVPRPQAAERCGALPGNIRREGMKLAVVILAAVMLEFFFIGVLGGRLHPKLCLECDGSGKSKKSCWNCNGTGDARYRGVMCRCDTCDGTGKIHCYECHGTGLRWQF